MLARIVKSTQIGSVVLRQYPRSSICSQIRPFSDKVNQIAEDNQSEQKAETNDKLGSFAKAFRDFEKLNETPPQKPVENVPFKKLLRDSKFVDVSLSWKFISVSLTKKSLMSNIRLLRNQVNNRNNFSFIFSWVIL